MVGAILSEGALRGVLAVLAVLGTLLLAFRYYQWNGSPWRRVHFRAMRVFAYLAGQEMGRSDRQGTQYDLNGVCHRLAVVLCGAEGRPDRQLSVEAMMDALSLEEGEYLAKLVSQQASKLLPTLTAQQIETLVKPLRAMELCPQLVIANVIENTFGEEEAARYALAILQGSAS